MKICVEGWRKINHSYAIVNQYQLIELISYPIDLYHVDVPYHDTKWNEKKNFSGFNEKESIILNSIKNPKKNNYFFDLVYRISFPFNFKKSNSKKLFIFGTSEKQNIEGMYINGHPKELNFRDETKIITPSNWSKVGFLSAGIKEKSVAVIPHGINSEVFFPLSLNDREKARENYQINQNDFVLLSVGSMADNKGIDLLILAYSILKKEKKNIKLFLKDQSNLYGLTVKSVIEKIKKTNYARFLSYEVLQDIKIISKNLNFKELNILYGAADCYVSPYLAEGFNLPPLEASSCGTPIIVTKGGSTDDYFEEKLGLQISSKKITSKNNNTILHPNLDSLLDCILKIYNEKTRFGGEVASDYVKNNFSWKKSVDKIYNLMK